MVNACSSGSSNVYNPQNPQKKISSCLLFLCAHKRGLRELYCTKDQQSLITAKVRVTRQEYQKKKTKKTKKLPIATKRTVLFSPVCLSVLSSG